VSEEAWLASKHNKPVYYCENAVVEEDNGRVRFLMLKRTIIHLSLSIINF
jgi:hypothetical protein